MPGAGLSGGNTSTAGADHEKAMPVSTEKQKAYPGGSLRSPEWQALRAEILERAVVPIEWAPGRVGFSERCECTGLCGHAHPGGRCQALNHHPHPDTGSETVLTIAHLDQDPGNSDRDNLLAACQRCHNAIDAPYRRKNAAETKAKWRAENLAIGDLFRQ